ncbi:MAG: hypothetical protein NUV73_02740 [Candidatus Daviesbacteria bacterium]|nr:hypothetical protein [Candidatus Daviesbacteria bacterium]
MDKDAETIADLEERMNQIITMAFILIKAIVRGGWNEIHADYLRSLYQDMQKIRGKSLKPLPETSDFVFLRVLLDNLITSSTKQQKEALSKIRDYAKQVEERIVAN